MRKVRTLLAIASLGAALLPGLAAPADAAARPAATAGASTNSFQFGVYYDLWACQYYGERLVASGNFSSYECVNMFDPPNGPATVTHWYLWLD